MNGCLLLDRDGIINEDHGYVCSPDMFDFLPGIFSLCRFFGSANYPIAIVTNQAGIAKGHYSEEDFQDLTQWMLKQFSARLINIDMVLFEPSHPQATRPEYRFVSNRRKPEPGMLLEALEQLHCDPGQSVLIGDKDSDVEAGLRAGIGRIYKLFSLRYPSRWLTDDGPVHIVHTLHQIIERENAR